MNFKNLYSTWKGFDNVTKDELEGLSKGEIEDRFYKDVEFGTGGIRGKIGAGTNRINFYTIGRATRGIVNYLLKNYNNPSVAIAYDSRNYSLEFAYLASYIFTNNGIKVYMFKEPTPTPILSFTVRNLKTSLGIVITASHNPKEYNGYKVYGDDGGQITKHIAEKIFNEISQLDYYYDISSLSNYIKSKENNINYIEEDLLNDYRERVFNLSFNKELIKNKGEELNIVYTPLHGTGGANIKKVLRNLGFTNVHYVENQMTPNGEFPTVIYPNPEEKEVFNEAIKLGTEKKADILIATDPDCDRVGIMIKENNGYVSLTGNEIGTILTYYVLSHLSEESRKKDSVIVKTIVTTDIVKEICKDFNIGLEEVLTGFKYIGEKIKEYENTDKNFILGFEESYGYLIGDFVRDKDAVIATSLICEIALYYKMQNITLTEILDKIYKKYGYYKEKLISYTLDGIEGMNRINRIMRSLRQQEFVKDVVKDNFDLVDYKKGIDNLPIEDVLTIETLNGKITVRPSGTEPKIKFYISTKGITLDESLEHISRFEIIINKIMKKVQNIKD